MTQLAPYAVTEANSRGRLAEPPPTARGEFPARPDRIVHCTAFRRLEYKTQVFVNRRRSVPHPPDPQHRSRSDHPPIARALHLNEDLAEAVALSHDLGTPFGHAGQEALNACMKDFGASSTISSPSGPWTSSRKAMPSSNGLNLMHETREGIHEALLAEECRIAR